MTRRSNSRKHCYVGFVQPSSSMHKRRNKAKARVRRLERQAARKAEANA